MCECWQLKHRIAKYCWKCRKVKWIEAWIYLVFFFWLFWESNQWMYGSHKVRGHGAWIKISNSVNAEPGLYISSNQHNGSYYSHTNWIKNEFQPTVTLVRRARHFIFLKIRIEIQFWCESWAEGLSCPNSHTTKRKKARSWRGFIHLFICIS